MAQLLDQVVDQFYQNSALELVAVIFAIAYLLLAVRQNLLCWPAALVSTTIFLWIFWDVQLYMESALQLYYIGMAIYGWYLWTAGDSDKVELPVTTWRPVHHVLVAVLLVIVTAVSGTLLSENTDAKFPYLDSFTTWASVITTYMVARKILENWAYWLVIDALSIYLYLQRDLYFTSLLFAVYIVIIFFGWRAWWQSYRRSQEACSATGAEV